MCHHCLFVHSIGPCNKSYKGIRRTQHKLNRLRVTSTDGADPNLLAQARTQDTADKMTVPNDQVSSMMSTMFRSLSATKLKGSENCHEWRRQLENTLYRMHLSMIVDGDIDCPRISDPKKPATAEDGKAFRQFLNDDRSAAGAIYESLSPVVANALPATLVRYTAPSAPEFEAHSKTLFDYLIERYSAVRPTQRVNLYRTLWRSTLPSGEDPV